MGKPIDITGLRSGNLVAIEPIGTRRWGQALWKCKCVCGEETIAAVGQLKSGGRTSCGCKNQQATNRLDITGHRFGRLTVLGYSYTKNKKSYWSCSCECGTEKVISGSHLRRGDVQSCGCLQKERQAESHVTHGMAGTPEHRCLFHMIDRCHRPNDKGFKDYGGRGITVCDRWRYGEGGKTGAECFLADILEDIGRRPSLKHSIDRVDNDGDYDRGNLRWSTKREQNLNRRPKRAEAVAAWTSRMRKLFESPEYRAAHSDRAKAMWRDPGYRASRAERSGEIRSSLVASWQNHKRRADASARLRAAWRDLQYRGAVLESRAATLARRRFVAGDGS